MVVFQRWDEHGPGDDVIIVANCSNAAKENYLIGLPEAGVWKLRINTDASIYSDDFSNCVSGDLTAGQGERDGLQAQAPVSIGPYSVLIYSKDRA